MMAVPVHDRFWSKVQRCADSECWPWLAHRSARGYGRIAIGRRSVGAHRVAWTITNGPIPSGKFILHHCDNPPCVNPLHLYVGTQADNVRDREERHRRVDPTGELHGRAKLTAAAVRTIRERAATGETHRLLASEFGVVESAIFKIVHRQNWRFL